jgi:hypothetical protein
MTRQTARLRRGRPLGPKARHALTLLHGSRVEGVTEFALYANGLEPDTLRSLVRRGYAKTRDHHYAVPKGLIVARLYITEAGIGAVR